jgi:hypothetical protein
MRIDFDRPYGTVYGSPEIAYVQGGAEFGPSGELVNPAPANFQEPKPRGPARVHSPIPEPDIANDLPLSHPSLQPIEDDPQREQG